MLGNIGRFGVVIAGASLMAFAEDRPKAADMTIYQFTVNDIDGKEVSLSKYKGDVVLIVNVASL